MSEPIFAIYGASGFGREVMPVARRQLLEQGISPDRLLFIDDEPKNVAINGHKVVRYEEFRAMNADGYFVAIAIAAGATRQQLAARCTSDGLAAWTVRAENVVTMDDVEIGDGAILSPFVTMTSNIRIGKYFHVNIYSYVAHDCIIGDFVTFAPGVKCNGNIVIEDHAYIGTGAVLRQGQTNRPLVIGRNAIVGMGAVVTKDVPPGVTVVGNPARIMESRTK